MSWALWMALSPVPAGVGLCTEHRPTTMLFQSASLEHPLHPPHRIDTPHFSLLLRYILVWSGHLRQANYNHKQASDPVHSHTHAHTHAHSAHLSRSHCYCYCPHPRVDSNYFLAFLWVSAPRPLLPFLLSRCVSVCSRARSASARHLQGTPDRIFHTHAMLLVARSAIPIVQDSDSGRIIRIGWEWGRKEKGGRTTCETILAARVERSKAPPGLGLACRWRRRNGVLVSRSRSARGERRLQRDSRRQLHNHLIPFSFSLLCDKGPPVAGPAWNVRVPDRRTIMTGCD
jgi:hypothetical protein